MSNINADSNPTGGGIINDTLSALNDTERVIDYLEHGYVEFRSNNFGAHIELESSIGVSDTLKTYTAPLPVIPITPFQVRYICPGEIHSMADINQRYPVLHL